MSTVYDVLHDSLFERLAENDALISQAETAAKIVEDMFARIRMNEREITEIIDALKCEVDHIERVEELVG